MQPLDYSFRLNNRGLLAVKDKISIESIIKKRPNLIFIFPHQNCYDSKKINF